MPELPEVETVARLLRPALVGRRLGECDVRWKRFDSPSKVPFSATKK